MQLNKIYNEDCLVTMSKMEDNSIDLVITSPPYNKAGYEGFIRKRHTNDSWGSRNISYGGDDKNDFMIESEYKEWQIKILNEIQRILKPNGSLFYNHKIRVAKHKSSHPIEWLLKTNLTFRQQLIWDRKSGPAVAPIRYIPSTELIFWMTKTPCQPNFERKKDCLYFGEVWQFSPKPNKLHPAPFPEQLPTNIMQCIKDTDNIVVYDPFSGIGTTCITAKKFGFNYIGSEINKHYCELSEETIKNI